MNYSMGLCFNYLRSVYSSQEKKNVMSQVEDYVGTNFFFVDSYVPLHESRHVIDLMYDIPFFSNEDVVYLIKLSRKNSHGN